MKVRTTQVVDYWIGVPLCGVLSAFAFCALMLRRAGSALVGRTQQPTQSPASPRKILFLELSEMGSAIIAHSSLAHTKRLFPDAELYFMVFSKNKESVSLLGVIPEQNLVLVDAKNFTRFAITTVLSLLRLRKLGIDAVIDLELFSRFTAMVSYLSGAKTRIGFHNYTAEGLYRGHLITHKVFYNPHQHMESNFLALVRSLIAPTEQQPLLKEDTRQFATPLPKFSPTPAESDALWKIIQKESPHISRNNQILVVNPDPGDALPIRGWPAERYSATVKQLLAFNPELYCIVIGLKGSKPYADALQKEVGAERVIDLTGKTRTLRDVVTLFTFSDVLLTNDSGPAHFAALTDIRSIALFGPETPALYGALGEGKVNIFAHYSCSPCLSAHNHRHTVCKDSLCLKAIDTAQVVAQAQGMIRESAALRRAALKHVG